MNHLSLFSGYEGFGLGLKLAGVPITTVGYVEIDEYCQKLLQARIRDGFLDWAPIIRDIRSADFRPMAGMVDILTAGFPCQGWSYSGTRKGEDDPRNLWPETAAVIDEVRSDWVILENVPGILPYYFDTIGPRLRCMGYCPHEGIYSAAEIGALHKRERLWVFAHSHEGRRSEWCRPAQQKGQHTGVARVQQPVSDGGTGLVAGFGPLSEWPIESRILRMDDGAPRRVAQLRAAGNGIVPAVVAEFLRQLAQQPAAR